jgi:hypothetical protein
MKSTVVRIAIAGSLIYFGWVAGKAQTAQPDFELVVNAPSGETTIECVRGCNLSWVERGLNPNASTAPTFKYSCAGDRCSSGKVGGWVPK